MPCRASYFPLSSFLQGTSVSESDHCITSKDFWCILCSCQVPTPNSAITPASCFLLIIWHFWVKLHCQGAFRYACIVFVMIYCACNVNTALASGSHARGTIYMLQWLLYSRAGYGCHQSPIALLYMHQRCHATTGHGHAEGGLAHCSFTIQYIQAWYYLLTVHVWYRVRCFP